MCSVHNAFCIAVLACAFVSFAVIVHVHYAIMQGVSNYEFQICA